MNRKIHQRNVARNPRDCQKLNHLKSVLRNEWSESEDSFVTKTCSETCESFCETDTEHLCEDCKKHEHVEENTSLESVSEESEHQVYHDKHRKHQQESPSAIYPCVVPRDPTRHRSFECGRTYSDKKKGFQARDEKRKKPLRILDSEDSLGDVLDSPDQFRSTAGMYGPGKKTQDVLDQDEYLEILNALQTYSAKKRRNKKNSQCKTEDGNYSVSIENDPRPRHHKKKSTHKLSKSCSVQTSIVLPSAGKNTMRSRSVQTSRHYSNNVWNPITPQSNATLVAHTRSVSAPSQNFRKQTNRTERSNVANSKMTCNTERTVGFEQTSAYAFDSARPAVRSREASKRQHMDTKLSRAGKQLSIYEKKFQHKFQMLSRRAEGRKKAHNKRKLVDQSEYRENRKSVLVNASELSRLANMIQNLAR